MVSKWIISSLALSAYLVSGVALAETQTIVPSASNFQVASGDTIEFDVNYSATSPQQTTGLGLNLYFDSSKVSLVNASDVFSKDKIAQDVSSDDANSDNDITTNKKITIAWASLSGNWPGTQSGDTNLLKVSFTTAQDFTSSTTINFTGNASAGNTFSASTVTISPVDNLKTSVADEAPEAITPTTSVASTSITSTSASLPETSGGGLISWLFVSFLFLLGVIRKGLFKKFNPEFF